MTTLGNTLFVKPTAVAMSGLLLVGATSCSKSSTNSTDAIQAETALIFEPIMPQIIREFRDAPGNKDTQINFTYGGTSTLTRQANLAVDHPDLMLLTSPNDAVSLRQTHTAQSTSSPDGSNALTSSPLVFMVRKNNPKGIKTWSDLGKKGVKIVSLDPTTAGAGQWYLAGIYGSNFRKTRSPAAAMAFTKKVMQNVTIWTTAFAKDTPLSVFSDGTGDVMLADEGQAIAARRMNPDLDYVVPPSTLRMDYHWALLKGAKPGAKSFLDYLRSTAGQRALAEAGWRPRDRAAMPMGEVKGAQKPKTPYPPVKDLFSIADLGTWNTINKLLFTGPNALMQTQ